MNMNDEQMRGPGPVSDSSHHEPAHLVGSAPGSRGHDPQPLYTEPATPVRPRSGRRHGIGTLAAATLAAALLGGAGGAGIMYGLNETAIEQGSSPTTSPEVRTIASSDSVNWVDIAQNVKPSVVAIDTQSTSGSGAGSGVVLSEDGYVLTNDHVVAGAENIQVTSASGQIVTAKIVGTDTSTDLAVLKLDTVPSDIVPASFGRSDNLIVGEPVVAVGNPLGLSQTVTTGIISALDRPVVTSGEDSTSAVVTNAIQIDAAINPGNSGGPLFNSSGEVIGINSSIASLSASEGGQAGSIGLGFAIPIDLAHRVAQDIIDNGSVEHAFVGVTTTSKVVTADGKTQIGAMVSEVVPGSPADQAGIKPGDAIVSINDDRIVSNTSLTGFVRQYAPGDEVTLEVVRESGQLDTVTLTLGTLEQ